MRARSVAFVAAIVATGVVAGLAIAQSAPGTPAARPTLHEPFADPGGDHGSPMIGSAGAGNPAAFSAGDKVLPKPSLDAATDDAHKTEPVLGKGGFAADRDTQMKPDEHTATDNVLHYDSVFNPDVLPFKRMSAFDKVGDDETLHIRSTALAEIPVGGTTDPRTKDRFWGDVKIQLTPGRDIPLPSVAPDMRILSYEIKPRMALKFSKDSADNFYVRSDEASASGEYRLVFLADADAGYFAPKLPRTVYRVHDVATHAPREIREMLTSLPPDVRREAMSTLRDNFHGLTDDAELGEAFNQLVSYFRAFQAGEIKNPKGDTYRDLCDSKTGVCRHRSFAFMITSNALGIPARMVENEAHAFVEVWFPERGWQRIDLGGAALRLEVSNGHDKTLHRPRSEDPFAKPPEYENKSSYTKLEGDIRGLSDKQLSDKHAPLDQAPSSGSFPGDGSGGGSAQLGSGDHISPTTGLPAIPPDPAKKSPVLTITLTDPSAYRGQTLHVEGIVTVERRPLRDHSVNIYIAKPGPAREGALLLGVATTGADGTFRTDVPIRAGAQLQTYEIYLTSDPDAYYNGAMTD